MSTPDPVVFSHRRYLLWKALDAWLIDTESSRGNAIAWAARARALPHPDPWPDTFPGRELLETRSLVPFVGPEDLIGASVTDVMRACPALTQSTAQKIVAQVYEMHGGRPPSSGSRWF